MLPPISGEKGASTSKLKWQKSTRRISFVKLPMINAKSAGKGHNKTAPPEEEPTSAPPAPPIVVPTVTPTLCIDNQYFSNYVNETHKPNDVDYLARAFKSFAEIQGGFHTQRTNYFEKRGLLEAIELNIEQQSNKISEALGCLSVCNQVAEKYHCSLSSSLEKLIDDFAEKAFKLSSLTCQLHALRQNKEANRRVKKAEESQLDEIAWRIERERRRIRKLDEKLERFYEVREERKQEED